MKCVKNTTSGNVSRTSDKHAAYLVSAWPEWSYSNKQEWKAGGRIRSGPQDGAPISVHPRAGSPPRHGKTRGKW